MKTYQCKIMVKDSKPPVWWRLRVPGGISFSALSLILDAVTGDKHSAFLFEVFRTARIREISDPAEAICADQYCSGYSAAHTALEVIFQFGKPIYYRGSRRVYRIEIESTSNEGILSFPDLIKCSSSMDGAAELRKQLGARFHFTNTASEPFSRSTLLRKAQKGVIALGNVPKELVEGESFFPSADAYFKKIAELLQQQTEQAGRKLPLNDLLHSCLLEDLRDLAEEYHLSKKVMRTKDALCAALTETLLKPETIRDVFRFMQDEDLRAYEAALQAKGVYMPPKDQLDCFDAASYFGYAFWDDDGGIVLPAELCSLYPVVCDAEFFLERRKAIWVLQCLNMIVPPYYGIMPLEKFCRLCRRTSDPVILPEEVPALLEMALDDESDCVLNGDELVARQAFEDPETYAYIKNVQGAKPYSIMREKEIEEIVKYGFPFREPSYARFVRFLRSELQLDENTANTITMMIHKKIAFGANTDAFSEALEYYKIRPTMQQAKDALMLYQKLHNNTRTFYNRGNTPIQMHSVAKG